MMGKTIPITEKIDTGSSKYPSRLRNIYKPPSTLYIWGRFRDFELPAIAIVGTRHCSAYGREIASEFAAELAKRGVVIVSGLAYGIDQAAHWGALSVGGASIAVVPGDMGDFYMRADEEIQNRLLTQGAMISEWPSDYPVEPWQFPVRNRLIAGLSQGVLVVEAPHKSGALITADHALEQGKEVFMVPGDIKRETSKGTNRWIQEGGAKLVTCVDDILCEIEPFKHSGVGLRLQAIVGDLPPHEKAIRDELLTGPKTWDELMEKVGIPIAEFSNVLLELEMKGNVRRETGRIHWSG